MDFRKASTQYEDFKGEIAIDSSDTVALSDLAKYANVPEKFLPIAYSINFSDSPFRINELSLRVAAVDTVIYGSNIEEIRANAHAEQNVKAQLFDGKINFYDLLSYMKRINFTFAAKGLGDLKIEVANE